MYWRGLDPSRHDTDFPIVAVLVFAWLLSAIGALDAGPVDYASLAAVSVVVTLLKYDRARSPKTDAYASLGADKRDRRRFSDKRGTLGRQDDAPAGVARPRRNRDVHL